MHQTLKDLEFQGTALLYGLHKCSINLEITLESIVDEISGMANLLMGEAGDGAPVAVIRGLKYPKAGDTLFMPRGVGIFLRCLKGWKYSIIVELAVALKECTP